MNYFWKTGNKRKICKLVKAYYEQFYSMYKI